MTQELWERRSGLGVRVPLSPAIPHISNVAVLVMSTQRKNSNSNISMAAVFPRVLIIVDSLLWLRGVFNRGSVGGKQTIFCLGNSHQSHKHKHKINNGAESGLRSRRGFFPAWKPAGSLLLLRQVCRPLLCFQDDLPHGTLQINHRDIPGNVSRAKMEASRFEWCCKIASWIWFWAAAQIGSLFRTQSGRRVRNLPSRLDLSLRLHFSFLNNLCTCSHREDTDSFLPLLPSGKYIPRVLCEGEPCCGDEGPPSRRFTEG